MGWRFRRSIGGKLFRVNIGKRGVSSVTFGGNGMPHVTTGRGGTRVGASIPGTGLYYTHTVGGKHADTAATQRIDSTPTMTFPAQSQTAVLPPSDGGTPPDTGGKHNDNGKPLPWSKLAISSLVLGLVALLCFVFAGFAAAVIFSFVAFPLGVAGLVSTRLRKTRRSTLLAVVAIILSVALFVASIVRMPASSVSSSASSPAPTHSVSASQKAAALNDEQARRQMRAEQEQHEKEAREKLDTAKGTLTSKLNDARSLLDSSNGSVADPTTRDALSTAIDTAAAIDSTNPDDWTAAVQPLQTSMDTVTHSMEKKRQDDADAAQAQQNTQQQDQTQQAPSQPEQQNSSGSLAADCVDGTKSYSRPGAPDYRGMCSHHHGIARKLGRQ